MWKVYVKGLDEPVMVYNLLGIGIGLPILVQGKLYEIVSCEPVKALL